MNLTTRKNVTKVLASVVLVGGAASVAGLGTFGAFTSTTSATESVSAGRVVIDMTNQAARGLDIAASNLVPGDTIQRAVQLTRGVDHRDLRLGEDVHRRRHRQRALRGHRPTVSRSRSTSAPPLGQGAHDQRADLLGHHATASSPGVPRSAPTSTWPWRPRS